MTTRTHILAGALLGLFSMTWAGPAAAQAYPSEPIRIVIGFAAGGPTDTYARLFADHLSRSLEQPVMVENVPGAGTILAGSAVKDADADGHTLFFTTSSTFIGLLLRDEAPFALADFAPVALTHSGANVIVVPPASPFATLGDLIDFGQQNPGELDFATTGAGGATHLEGEYFNFVFGTESVAVDYSGGAAGLEGVMTGEVDYSFIAASAAIPQIQAGKVKPLAITKLNRGADLPDVPTIDEVAAGRGIASLGWNTGAWYGLLVEEGTPQEIIDTLNAEMIKFIESDDIKQRQLAEGVVPGGRMTPAEFAQFIDADIKVWAEVIAERKIEID